ncbi:TetR/AcrR family transcriptional regulator [Georgenia sunbinii]|uniref:TetR/AcrR family transcriptional regulator n=1 Tax=Georgenia sunbinii TaxID=3117728 RepID=UPI002F2634DA
MTPRPGPPPDERPARTYRSPLRTRRAAETRERIAASARDLFAEHGFAGTTVAEVAEVAGVTPQTVYATFGSKGAIVGALLAQLEHDADAAGWLVRVRAEADPRRKLADFAAWTSALLSSSKVALTAMHVAAGDPALAELRTQGDQHRRAALRELVTDLEQAGALSRDLTIARGVDRAWMLTGVELYLAARDACGWSDAEYADWLTRLLQDQLLDHPGDRLGRP